MTDPTRVLVAGDWHGNTRWALKVITRARELLADQEPKIILHCGDFGIWPGPGGFDYLSQVCAALDQAGMALWFVDGNHENHDRLDAEYADAKFLVNEGLPVPLSSGHSASPPDNLVLWLWRGCRWTWHGRTWMACGGGVSLDRVIRSEGRSWWPQEEISDVQEARIIAGGRADVMLSHDRPSGVVHSFPDSPAWWDQHDIDRNERHVARMQRIVDTVQPAHLIHGHLHRAYSRACEFGYGPVQVTGLAADGMDGNYMVLNVETMTWEAGDD